MVTFITMVMSVVFRWWNWKTGFFRPLEKRKKPVRRSIFFRILRFLNKGSLCPECRQLHDYALTRIDKCPFMETKTFCSACKVHCYKPEMREKIRAVMRWAGPRMLPVHPVLSIRHAALTLRSKREAKKDG